MAEEDNLAAMGNALRVHEKLDDIDNDVDWIKECLCREESNMYNRYDNGFAGFDAGLMAGMMNNNRGNDMMAAVLAGMQNRGIDPMALCALVNDRRSNGWGDGDGWMMMMFLFFLLAGGWGGMGGFGNRGYGATDGALGVQGIDRTIVNEANNNIIREMIHGNEQAIRDFAIQNNTSFDFVRSALCQIDKSLATNNGDMKAAVQQCCCNTQNAISNLKADMLMGQANINSNMQMGFCNIGNAIAGVNYNLASQVAALTAHQDQQYCNLQQQITAGLGALSTQMTAGFCDLEMRELKSRNEQLQRELAALSQASQTQQIITAINNKDALGFNGTISGTTFTGTGTLS